jgi:RND family efflux transporter MFP subunit
MGIGKTIAGLLSVPVVLVAVSGCEEEAARTVERIRAIKPFTVTEPAAGIVRRYTGKIEAAEKSSLSFAVSGTVAKVMVAAGDRVKRDQVLARLDTKTFDLDLRSAQAELRSSQAKLAEARQEQKRKSQLFKKGWVTKAAYDTAVAKAVSAQGAVDSARSQMGRAQRDITKTRLVAPFNGAISKREVEPFTEIKAGSTVFEIDASGSREIRFSVPDAIVSKLSISLPVQIGVTTLSDCGCSGHITEIGSASGPANAVDVIAALTSSPPTLLPGMSADVQLSLSDSNTGSSGYLVPLSTIAPSAQPGKGYVFKFDRSAGIVRKVRITGREGRENLVQVIEGVSAGDILAAAGVSFLRDGQKVKLLGE